MNGFKDFQVKWAQAGRKNERRRRIFRYLTHWNIQPSKKTKVEQKAKLRVGRTKPKPANHTETSFKSKGGPQLRNLSRKY